MFKRLILVVIAALAGCAAGGDRPGLWDMQKIADPNTDEAKIVDLIIEQRQVAPSADEEKAWLRIAESDRYSPVRRRSAVIQLFDRYVQLGMSLKDVARILDGWPWLKAGDVVVDVPGDMDPIDVRVAGESGFIILMAIPDQGEAGVFLRIKGEASTGEVFEALRGEPSAAADFKITAMYASENDRPDGDVRMTSAPRDLDGR